MRFQIELLVLSRKSVSQSSLEKEEIPLTFMRELKKFQFFHTRRIHLEWRQTREGLDSLTPEPPFKNGVILSPLGNRKLLLFLKNYVKVFKEKP